MKGCQYQNESFSVTMSQKLKKHCTKCRKEIEGTIYLLNGDELCKVCFCSKPSKLNNGIGSFLTTKDQLYNFVDINTTGKPIRFTSKRQWQQHLKKHGLTDDIKQGNRSDDLMRMKSNLRSEPKLDREEIKKLISERFKETGTYDKLVKRR